MVRVTEQDAKAAREWWRSLLIATGNAEIRIADYAQGHADARTASEKKIRELEAAVKLLQDNWLPSNGVVQEAVYERDEA